MGWWSRDRDEAGRRVGRPLIGGAVLLLICAAMPGCIGNAHRPEQRGAGSPLAEYVQRAGGYGFSGAVLATHRGRVLIEQASGLADVAAGRPNTPDTLFYIASLAKQFTATAILKLEEEGRLSTSDRVGRFFPDLPAPIAAVTLHQLLTHSSGLPWNISEAGRPLTKGAFFTHLGGARLEFAPGERFSYSNAGYSLLAAIVEQASGLSFETFLRERLFAPAGMVATGYLTGPLPRHPAARGYLAGEDRGFPWEAPESIGGRPSWTSIGAGSIVSTPRDMDRWAAALLAGQIIRPASLARLFSCQIETGPGECYGYGWNVETEAGRRLIWHDGSNGSFWARLSIYPDEGLRLTTMSNKSLQYASIADSRLRRALLGGAAPVLPPRALQLSPDEATELAGRYQFGPAEIGFERVGSDLFVEPRNGEALALLVTAGMTGQRAATLTAIAAPILRAASAGDFEPLRASAASDLAYRSMRDSLSYLRDRGAALGGFREFGLVGTSLGPTGSSDTLATYGFANFGAGRAPIRLAWQGDRLSDLLIQTATFVTPPRFAVQRLGPNRFAAHSLALQRTIEVVRGGGGAITIIIDGHPHAGTRLPAPVR